MKLLCNPCILAVVAVSAPSAAAFSTARRNRAGTVAAIRPPTFATTVSTTTTAADGRIATRLYYNDDGPSVSSSDPSPYNHPKPPSQQRSKEDKVNPFYCALETTQQWIDDHTQDMTLSSFLRQCQQLRSSSLPVTNTILFKDPSQTNHLAFICETSGDPAIIVANIFRKLKEARIIGEEYSQNGVSNKGMKPQIPLKQTQVYVVPTNLELANDFPMFDRLMNGIAHAHQHAQEYVTDQKLVKHSNHLYGIADTDWSVSVNCAHMHPMFGQNEDGSMAMVLSEMHEGRQSPYPTVIVEVISQPYDAGLKDRYGDTAMSPAFSSLPGTQSPLNHEELYPVLSDTTMDFAQKLHITFTKSVAYTKNDNNDDESRPTENPQEAEHAAEMMASHRWMAQYDPNWDIDSSSFCVSTAQFADEAYEFVFASLAAQTSRFMNVPSEQIPCIHESKPFRRLYLVMPDFISCSATSFIRFGVQVQQIISAMPASISKRVHLELFHPESIHTEQQSPYPVFVLHWK